MMTIPRTTIRREHILGALDQIIGASVITLWNFKGTPSYGFLMPQDNWIAYHPVFLHSPGLPVAPPTPSSCNARTAFPIQLVHTASYPQMRIPECRTKFV